MIRNTHPATLAATAIVSLAVGFGVATLLPSRAAPIAPIIDANAWQEAAPAPSGVETVSTTTARAKACSPWEISDVAMEEVLDEMIRRGWRPPNQGEAVAAMGLAQTVGLSATDPNAPMPYRGSALLSDLLVREEGDELEKPTGDAQPVDPSTTPAAPEPPAPPPA